MCDQKNSANKFYNSNKNIIINQEISKDCRKCRRLTKKILEKLDALLDQKTN